MGPYYNFRHVQRRNINFDDFHMYSVLFIMYNLHLNIFCNFNMHSIILFVIFKSQIVLNNSPFYIISICIVFISICIFEFVWTKVDWFVMKDCIDFILIWYYPLSNLVFICFTENFNLCIRYNCLLTDSFNQMNVNISLVVGIG